MKLSALAAAVVALAAATSANAATNLITNGSFESGTIQWTYSSTGTDALPGHHPAVVINYGPAAPYPTGAFNEAIPADNSLSASPDAVGVKGLYFVADNSTETLSQVVHLKAGTYQIGFSAYVPRNGFNNSGNATLTAVIAGANLASFDVDHSPIQKWVNYSGFTTIATEGNYTTSFTYRSGAAPAGDFVIDRAYVIAVPEPATWGLMIMGFGGAGAMLRRRRMAVA